MTPKENAAGAMHPSGIQKTHTRNQHTQAGRQAQGSNAPKEKVAGYSLAGLVCLGYREAEIAALGNTRAGRKRALEIAQHHLRDATGDSVIEWVGDINRGLTKALALYWRSREISSHPRRQGWLHWAANLRNCIRSRLLPGLLAAHKARPSLDRAGYEGRIKNLVATIDAEEIELGRIYSSARRLLRLPIVIFPILNEMRQLVHDILRDIEGEQKNVKPANDH